MHDNQLGLLSQHWLSTGLVNLFPFRHTFFLHEDILMFQDHLRMCVVKTIPSFGHFFQLSIYFIRYVKKGKSLMCKRFFFIHGICSDEIK
jgi:hypothetical protein